MLFRMVRCAFFLPAVGVKIEVSVRACAPDGFILRVLVLFSSVVQAYTGLVFVHCHGHHGYTV